jgi:hypothetical protein
MMCAVVVRRVKPGAYEAFREAWIGRAEDDPDVVATWGLFDLDEAGLDAMRDDHAWIAAESRRMERMAPHEEELVISSYFHVAEEVVPPAARASR